ncbi:hypothetical protein QT989_32690, partial [Microcoleus sp. SVA1_B6]
RFHPILPFFVYPLDNLHFFLTCHKWVEYDCRIIYSLDRDSETAEELIILIDIGTHDEVY